MITRKYDVEIVPQIYDELGIYESAEIGARICYKSEGVIKYNEDGRSITAKPFVDKLMYVNKHGSIAEHGAVYLKIRYKGISSVFDRYVNNVEVKYENNPYSKVVCVPSTIEDYLKNSENRYVDVYITTNLRVLTENKWLDDLKYLVPMEKYHIPRVMVKFNSQCIISREAHRHRTHSPSEQSTRYCNYSKDKFGGEVNISVPIFAENCQQIKDYNNTVNKEVFLKNYCYDITNNNNDYFDKFDYWMFGNLASEFAYLGMIKCGAIPDEARTILPLDTHTEFVHSAYIWDWFDFLKLRCASNAHKDIQVLAYKLKDMLVKQGYFTEEEFNTYDKGWKLYEDKFQCFV